MSNTITTPATPNTTDPTIAYMQCLATAKLTALEALLKIVTTTDDEKERRQAATTILRTADPEPPPPPRRYFVKPPPPATSYYGADDALPDRPEPDSSLREHFGPDSRLPQHSAANAPTFPDPTPPPETLEQAVARAEQFIVKLQTEHPDLWAAANKNLPPVFLPRSTPAATLAAQAGAAPPSERTRSP